MINAQTMDNIKGTYKLTSYTKTYDTPADGKSVDYITDYAMEAYLVVTGESEGWYVVKTNVVSAYAKKVTLSYEYDTQNTSEVCFVFYQDSTESARTRLGVQENTLTHSAPSVTIGDLGRPYSISMTFEKADTATDLSYAQAKLGEMPIYGFGAYRHKGLYYLQENAVALGNAEEEYVSDYIYCYVELDTAGMTATAHYALRSTGEQYVKTLTVEEQSDWASVLINGEAWTEEWQNSTSYMRAKDGSEMYQVTQYLHLWWLAYTPAELEEQIAADMQAYLDTQE